MATRTISETFSSEQIFTLLNRFAQKDWGNLCKDDVRLNEEALKNNGRLLGSYTINSNVIYIITEADRSCTTVLFADEY
ncbi:hypothetical protein QJU87_04285 [Pasteurella skyensis]|uniref:hypothetical protein n=1 Tax=Phocoenobacter skyensis TaxID=97481 RepID=UPI002755B14F|nr:hypothetical protein [Pasteurella skyensis]MDP8189083.1 hypothetical protein [Pasteurella skyensis]